MKTEMEKCLAGEWYDCHDPFFMDLKSKAHHLLMKYNSLPYEQKTEKYAVLKEMFGSIGANVSVGHSFICDYGCNIHIGDNVTVNTGCTFVDCNKITIGNNVLVAPNVQIYTATHPVEFNERLVLTETPDGCKYVRRTFALPVMIEDGCWIGGGVIILPGVTIGQKCVISAGIVAKAAGVLGYREEQEKYQKLSEEQFAVVQEEYYSATGRCCIKTQTALLLTLKYHLSKNEELTKRQLLKLFEQSNHKLKTGFVGTPLLNNVLTDNGMNDLAYELLLNEEFPGWLYEVKLGATTVWERWNSLLTDGTISGISMNSMNHYAYGSIQEWMFRHVAGINTMESHPGARTVQFAPTLNWDLRYAEAKYDSASGMYSIRWELSDKEHVTITMDVPFDCTAEAVLPMVAKSEKEAVAEVLGSEENGRYLLEPGHYEVSYQLSEWKEKTAVCVE